MRKYGILRQYYRPAREPPFTTVPYRHTVPNDHFLLLVLLVPTGRSCPGVPPTALLRLNLRFLRQVMQDSHSGGSARVLFLPVLTPHLVHSPLLLLSLYRSAEVRRMVSLHHSHTVILGRRWLTRHTVQYPAAVRSRLVLAELLTGAPGASSGSSRIASQR